MQPDCIETQIGCDPNSLNYFYLPQYLPSSSQVRLRKVHVNYFLTSIVVFTFTRDLCGASRPVFELRTILSSSFQSVNFLPQEPKMSSFLFDGGAVKFFLHFLSHAEDCFITFMTTSPFIGTNNKTFSSRKRDKRKPSFLLQHGTT